MRVTLTIRLDDELVEEARNLARETGRSLSAVIEEALRQHLAHQQTPGKRARVRLITVAGQGLLPGVDLDDSASLLDIMKRDAGSL